MLTRSNTELVVRVGEDVTDLNYLDLDVMYLSEILSDFHFIFESTTCYIESVPVNRNVLCENTKQ